MKIVLINENIKIENKDSYAVCLGIFDGVHSGHRVIMEKTVEIAKENNLKSAVLTFLNKDVKNRIYSLEEQAKLIEKIGIDTLFIVDFNKSFKNLSPATFIDEYLISYLNAKEIICGFNYRFGKDCVGDTNTLKEFENKGYRLTVVPPVTIDNEVVSSTLIRECLINGNIKKANKLLGDNYSISGVVIKCNELGRKIGFPTANVYMLNENCAVKSGVYSSCVYVNGSEYKGISNIGIAPTVRDNNNIIVETHIINFSGNLYNEYINVKLKDFIREEKKFSSVDELKKEIEKNVKTVCEEV